MKLALNRIATLTGATVVEGRIGYMRRKTIAESQCGGPIAINSKCYQTIMQTGQILIQSPSPGEIDFNQFGRPAR
jgi:hypothetical protein